MRLALALSEKDALERQLGDVNRQLENMLDRIVEANSTSVVSTYETRIEKLERDKLVLNDKIAKSVPPKGRLEDCIELSLKLLSNPWNIWKNGDFTMRQAVLRLAFAEPLRYSQNGVYRTPKLSFPFKCLGGFSGSKSEMVRSERLELSRVLPHSDLNAARLPFRHDRTSCLVARLLASDFKEGKGVFSAVEGCAAKGLCRARSCYSETLKLGNPPPAALTGTVRKPAWLPPTVAARINSTRSGWFGAKAAV